MSVTTEQVRYVFDAVTDKAVSGLNAMSKGFDSLSSGFKKINTLGNQFSKAINTSTSAVNGFKKAASALSGVAIGKAFASATKEAIDFYETLNLFQVAMKESIDVGNEFIDNTSEWYGLDPKNLMQYTGMFYEMAYAVDAPDKAAQQLATSLTALSVDLASLFNVDVERVTDNLTSGMRGMSRAVVKYGLDLRASTVEAYAHSIGIKEQYETMNEASREILRYLVAVKQAKDATGDFGETIEQPANQLRVFKEQMSQVGRAIGTFLVQPLQAALPIINGVTMAIRVMLETIASLMGFKLEIDSKSGLDDTENALTGIGASADDAKKKMKALLAPFDELNVIQENNAGGGGAGSALGYGEVDPLLLAALEEAQYSLDEVRMKAMDTRDAILEFFGFTPTDIGWMHSFDKFEANLKKKLPNWTKSIEAAFDLDWDSITANYHLVMNDLKNVVKDAVSIILQDFGRLTGIKITDDSLSEWISNLDDKFRQLRIWLHENEDRIAKITARVFEAVIAFKAFTVIAGVLGTIFGGIGTALGGIVSGFALLQPIASVVSNIFTELSIGTTLLRTHFIGMKNAIGASTKGLAVAGTSGASFVGVIQDLLTMLAQLSPNIVAMGALMATVFVGGIAKWIATSDEFRAHLGRWGEALKTIFVGVRDIFMVIFNAISISIDTVATRFSGFFDGVTGVISSLIEVLAGFVEWLAGVFTGDIDRRLKGIQQMFWGFANILNSIWVAVTNLIIGGVNFLVDKIVNGIIGAVQRVLDAISDILAFVGIHFSINVPTIDPIPFMPAPTLPKFATGGVVTGPTHALIGEAGRAEMVMPLDNSPQMLEFIDKIADKVGNSGETVVKVYIGDREWDAFTYESAQRGQKLVGAQPIKEGRA